MGALTIEEAVRRLGREPVGLQCKPFPAMLAGTSLGDVGGLGWRLGDGRLMLPEAVLAMISEYFISLPADRFPRSSSWGGRWTSPGSVRPGSSTGSTSSSSTWRPRRTR